MLIRVHKFRVFLIGNNRDRIDFHCLNEDKWSVDAIDTAFLHLLLTKQTPCTSLSSCIFYQFDTTKPVIANRQVCCY